MTTVAWDGRVLVGDRLSHIGGTPIRARKVYRVREPNGRIALIGFGGSMAVVESILRLLKTGEKLSIPTGKWTAMKVDDRLFVSLMNSEEGAWDCLGRVKWAIGSGADYALGAMYAGKPAVDAVRIASRLDIETGMGFDTVAF